MRRRADDLDAALVRLVVGLRALERGQKGVVDVDDAAGHGGAERGSQDLHVAGQHDEVDPLRFDQLEDLGFLLRARLGRGGEVVEGDRVGGCQGREVCVVGHDQRDVDGQLVGGLAEEEVVEAVPDLRDHQHDARSRGVGVELVGHGQGLGDVVEFLTQLVDVHGRAGFQTTIRAEVYAHEEGRGGRVTVLLGVDDVEVMLREEAGHGVHDAGPVRT